MWDEEVMVNRITDLKNGDCRPPVHLKHLADAPHSDRRMAATDSVPSVSLAEWSVGKNHILSPEVREDFIASHWLL